MVSNNAQSQGLVFYMVHGSQVLVEHTKYEKIACLKQHW